MASSTATLRRLEAGSVMAIAKHTTNGTTNLTWVYILKGIQPGTVKWERGFYKALPYTDRGVMQMPYEGDEMPTSVSAQFKYSGASAAADIYAYLDASGLATGLMQMYTISLWHPTAKGQSTGELIVFNKVYFDTGSVKYSAGTEYDMLDIDGTDMEVKPTVTTGVAAPS